MDFVFDRTAEGRVIKNLTVVYDATHEAVAIVPERAIGGLFLTRMLDHLALQRGLPSAIRTDNAVMGASTWRCTVFNRAWKTQSKRLHRIV